MHSLLSIVLLFTTSQPPPVPPFPDVVLVSVTDRDKDGRKYDKNMRKVTIQTVHSANREERLIQFLKTQQLHEEQPWRQWRQLDRKENNLVVYTVFVDADPGFLTLRMLSDTASEKTFLVTGHASLAAMQALSGDGYQLYSLTDPILYGRRKLR